MIVRGLGFRHRALQADLPEEDMDERGGGKAARDVRVDREDGYGSDNEVDSKGDVSWNTGTARYHSRQSSVYFPKPRATLHSSKRSNDVCHDCCYGVGGDKRSRAVCVHEQPPPPSTTLPHVYIYPSPIHPSRLIDKGSRGHHTLAT